MIEAECRSAGMSNQVILNVERARPDVLRVRVIGFASNHSQIHLRNHLYYTIY